jgi:hypothetical protein
MIGGQRQEVQYSDRQRTDGQYSIADRQTETGQQADRKTAVRQTNVQGGDRKKAGGKSEKAVCRQAG